MATYTTNYNLKKPAATDNINVLDINGNMDTIDSTMKTISDQVLSLGVGTKLVDEAIRFGTTYSATDKSFTIAKPSIVTIVQNYNAGQPLAIGCKSTNTTGGASVVIALGIDGESTSGLTATGFLPAGTYYIWGKRSISSSTGNGCIVYAYPIKA